MQEVIIDLSVDDNDDNGRGVASTTCCQPSASDVIDLTGSPDISGSRGNKRKRLNDNIVPFAIGATSSSRGGGGLLPGRVEFPPSTAAESAKSTTQVTRNPTVLGSTPALDVPLAAQAQALNALLLGAAQIPSGPSWRENSLVERLEEFGMQVYGFEVPLGNGVCDCVAVDSSSRLCIVEAKCMSKGSGTYKRRRAKVVEQCSAYGRYLAQQTMSDVTAYIFDDTDGMINLEEYATYRYAEVKDDLVRPDSWRWGP